jgi:hypothetical protein
MHLPEIPCKYLIYWMFCLFWSCAWELIIWRNSTADVDYRFVKHNYTMATASSRTRIRLVSGWIGIVAKGTAVFCHNYFMRDLIPIFVVGLVFLYGVAASLYELADREKVRFMGVDWFGERTWKLVEHNLTIAALATVTSGVGFILLSEKWSAQYIFGLCLIGVGWFLFTLAIVRTGFFAVSVHRKAKEVISSFLVAIIFISGITVLPRKRLFVKEYTPPAPPIAVMQPPAQSPASAPKPRSYLVFDGSARFGDRRDSSGNLVADQNLHVGDELAFNYYFNPTGPNPILVNGRASLAKLEPDFSLDTQNKVIGYFRAEIKKEKREHPISQKWSIMMPQDKGHWDTAYGWTDDFKQHHILTVDELNALRFGTTIAFVLVEISYKDNGKLHHLRTCQFLQPPATPPGVWHFCDKFTNPD